MTRLVFIVFLGLLCNFTIFAESMARQPLSEFAANPNNARCPTLDNVNKAKFSICSITISSQGYTSNGTGVLITPRYVLSTMHGFDKFHWTPQNVPKPSEVSITFAYDTRKFTVNSFSPVPDNISSVKTSDYKDFILLEIKETDVVSTGKIEVAAIDWEWGLSQIKAKTELPSATKAFILHHGKVEGNPATYPLSISYATTSTAKIISPTYYKPWGINTPYSIEEYFVDDWSSYTVNESSSGGGIFNDDGKLIAIVLGNIHDNPDPTKQGVRAIPIDYIIDQTSGSPVARTEFNATAKSTVPIKYINDIKTIWSHTYADVTANNSTIPAIHNVGGHIIYLGSSTDKCPSFKLLGSNDIKGKYEITIWAMASTATAATYLNDYSTSQFATLSISNSSGNNINNFTSKSSILGSDLTKDQNGNSQISIQVTTNVGVPAPTKIVIPLEVRNVENCILSITGTSLLDDPKIQGISIHDIEIKWVGSLGGGGKVGSAKTPSGSISVSLSGNYGSAMYALSNGCVYNMAGACANCGSNCPSVETAFRDIRDVGFLGAYHESDGNGYTINWGDNQSTSRGTSTYHYITSNSANTHIYKKAGNYSINVTWKDWNFLWLGKHDHSTAIPILVPPFEAEKLINSEKYISINKVVYSGGLAKTGIPLPKDIIIGHTEVTQGEYSRTTEMFPFNNFSNTTFNYPAENVTFYDAIIFCNLKSQLEGLENVYSYTNPIYSPGNANCIALSNITSDLSKNGYRLPTEPEWQKTYLDNSSSNMKYYWGNSIPDNYAWYASNSGQKTHPVGHRQPNSSTVYDMAGNVAEYIWMGTDNTGKPIGGKAGGSYKSIPADLECTSSIITIDKSTAYPDVGIRCVRNATNSLNVNFTATQPQGQAPYPVTFTTQVSGTAIKWLWDFGDGWMSEEQNPTHVYKTLGSYSVTLTAFGQIPNQTRQITKTSFVNITKYIPPIALMDWSKSFGDVPATVQFAGSNTGGPLSANPWFWDFGDGVTSNLQNPSHTYTKRGLYPVKFVVTGLGGEQSTSEGFYFKASEPAPNITIGASKVTGVCPLKVQFSGINNGGQVYSDAWWWDFGDGEIFNGQNIEHIFKKPGDYSVNLKAIGPDYTAQNSVLIKAKADITPIINLLLND